MASRGPKGRGDDPRAADDDPRAALEAHVVEVQRTIRSCAGCGLCCTSAHNAVQILPLEAERVARWIEAQPAERSAELRARVERTIRRHRLEDDAEPRLYTCAFL